MLAGRTGAKKRFAKKKAGYGVKACGLFARSLAPFFNYVAPVVSFIILVGLIHENTNLRFALEVEYNDKMIGYIEKRIGF